MVLRLLPRSLLERPLRAKTFHFKGPNLRRQRAGDAPNTPLNLSCVSHVLLFPRPNRGALLGCVYIYIFNILSTASPPGAPTATLPAMKTVQELNPLWA